MLPRLKSRTLPAVLIPLLTETFDAETLLADADFCAEGKADGVRCLLISDASGVRGVSRQLRALKLTAGIVEAARMMRGDFILDGELVGSQFIAFDVQRLAGADVSALPMRERFAMLASASPFPVVRFAIGTRAKRALLAAVRAEGGEGVVFKRMDAPCVDGRDANMVKFKLWQSASFVVADRDVARGSVGLLRDGADAGRCCFPFAGQWPRVGEVVEVRFARVHESGKLCQPVMLGVRHDLAA